MIISHYSKLIFIHVHRTGGTTISHLIRSKLDRNLNGIAQHGNARTSESHLLEKYNYYYSFGFTRNPWDRILSWYSLIHKSSPKSLMEERKRFETFIESNAASDFNEQFFHYNSIDYFTNERGELKVDSIYRYENYDTAVKELMNRFNLPLLEIPRLNDTENKGYREFYTKKSQRLIAEKCSLDIERFNYCF